MSQRCAKRARRAGRQEEKKEKQKRKRKEKLEVERQASLLVGRDYRQTLFVAKGLPADVAAAGGGLD